MTIEEQLEILEDNRITLSVLQQIPLQYVDEYTDNEMIQTFEKIKELQAKSSGKSFTRPAKTKELEIAGKLKQKIRDKHGKRGT